MARFLCYVALLCCGQTALANGDKPAPVKPTKSPSKISKETINDLTKLGVHITDVNVTESGDFSIQPIQRSGYHEDITEAERIGVTLQTIPNVDLPVFDMPLYMTISDPKIFAMKDFTFLERQTNLQGINITAQPQHDYREPKEDIEVPVEFCKALAKVSSLKTLSFRSGGIHGSYGKPIKLSEQDCDAIAQLPSLKTLIILQNCRVSTKGMICLEKCSKLQSLSIGGAAVPARTFKSVAAMPMLRELNVSETAFDSDILKEISELKRIETLRISGDSEDWDQIAALKEMAQLRTLSIYSYLGGIARNSPNPSMNQGNPQVRMFRDKHVAALAQLNQVQNLTLNSDSLTDVAVPDATKLKNLKVLCLGCSAITGTGFETAPKEGEKLEVRFQANHVSDAGMKAIAMSPRIRKLVLDHRYFVTAEGFKELTKSSSLESLEVSGIYREEFQEICGIKSLKELAMSGPILSEQEYRIISNLESLTSLTIKSGQITEGVLNEIAGLKKLRKLGLPSMNAYSPQVFAIIKKMEITELDLSNSANLSGKMIEILERSKTLKKLNLSGCPKVTNEAVDELKAALPDCEVVR